MIKDAIVNSCPTTRGTVLADIGCGRIPLGNRYWEPTICTHGRSPSGNDRQIPARSKNSAPGSLKQTSFIIHYCGCKRLEVLGPLVEWPFRGAWNDLLV